MLTMNTQTDKRWSNEIMTACEHPNWEGKTWIDYIWRWGCLITAIANIIQFFSGKEFLPSDMNNLCVELKAYTYLRDQKCKESVASNLNFDAIEKYFSEAFKFKYNLSRDKYKKQKNIMYVARVIHEKTGSGHYINIITKNKLFWGFDVETGIIRSYEKEEIKSLLEIKDLFGEG